LLLELVEFDLLKRFPVAPDNLSGGLELLELISERTGLTPPL
jgi:hypothetical protein